MPLIQSLALSILLSVAATGCAARFQQPAPEERHALLALPSQQSQHDRGVFIEPMELNGLARPRNWLLESFRVPPGRFHLMVRAAHESLQGTCRLQFNAVAGQRYLLDAALADGNFTLGVFHDGQLLADCSAPATPLPTPARIPGAPSR
jgi:hypothetical protein